MTDFNDFLDEEVTVWYADPNNHPGFPYTFDGMLLGLSAEGVEGQYLLAIEAAYEPEDEFGWEEQFRCIPIEWVEQVSPKEAK